MKALSSFALMLLLCSCQKEIMFPVEPETVIVKEEPPKEVIYRAEPDQQIEIMEFAPMLWQKKQYKITEYYCVARNLWQELPEWVKDDVYTFQEFGEGWVDGGTIKNPSLSFETIKKTWQLYGDGTDYKIKLDWINENYESRTYTLVAFEKEKSFTLCYKVNDSKVFVTYSLLKG